MKLVELVWEPPFDRMKDAMISTTGSTKNIAVIYIIADEDRRPLYIGQSSNKSGLRERYQGQDGAIDAAMDGCVKKIFLAKADPGISEDVERFLILKEKPPYNAQRYKPKQDLDVRHSGSPPKFRYLSL